MRDAYAVMAACRRDSRHPVSMRARTICGRRQMQHGLDARRSALQRKGRKVSVVSTMFTQPPLISDNFRRQADHFIDLITSRSELDATRQNICRVRPLSDEAAVDAGV